MNALFAPTLNLTLLIFALVFFLRRPVSEFLANRSAEIRRLVGEGIARREEAESKLKEFTKRIENIESEVNQVFVQAQERADKERERILRDAREHAERILKDAEQAVSLQVSEMQDRIRKEVVLAAIAHAEKLLEQQRSEDDRRRIIHEYVEGVRL